jgi:creatinine deaminase
MPGPLDEGMREAIVAARHSGAEGGIPIGACLVDGEGQVLACGHNRRVQCSSATLHAEIDCLERAGRQRNYRGVTLYSTLMPCYMCAGAIIQFEIAHVVVGDSATFVGAGPWLRERGVLVDDLDLVQCREPLEVFIRKHPEIWYEDIGQP